MGYNTSLYADINKEFLSGPSFYRLKRQKEMIFLLPNSDANL
jgi:hypothetical protein